MYVDEQSLIYEMYKTPAGHVCYNTGSYPSPCSSEAFGLVVFQFQFISIHLLVVWDCLCCFVAFHFLSLLHRPIKPSLIVEVILVLFISVLVMGMQLKVAIPMDILILLIRLL